MLNIFDELKITLGSSYDREALSEIESKITGHYYEILPVDYQESDSDGTYTRTAERDCNQAQCRDNGSSIAKTNCNRSDIIYALEQIKVESDFIDVSRVMMDVSETVSYHPSPIFSNDDMDIDSFDCVSIKV